MEIEPSYAAVGVVVSIRYEMTPGRSGVNVAVYVPVPVFVGVTLFSAALLNW